MRLTTTSPMRWLPHAGEVLFGRALSGQAQEWQLRLLRRRLRLLAVAIGMAVLGWAAVEAVVLEAAVFGRLLLLRLPLAAALLGLAWAGARIPPLLGLCLMMLLQAALFTAMYWQLPDTAPYWLRLGYELFPFVLAAQLALLPLAALHTLLLATPALAVVPVQLLTGAQPLLHAAVGLWLQGLILLLAMWASAAQLAMLLELLAARWEAAHDPMTGLANRRHFNSEMEAEGARSRRRGSPLSVLMLDLDRFKTVNDRHGHGCGDRVIAALGRLLLEEQRGGDIAGRAGGEEFVLLLPDSDLDEATQVAERLRRRVEATTVSCKGIDLRVTVSIGVAQLQSGETPQDMLVRADTALYAAKAAGRNRVERAEGGSAAAPAAAASATSSRGPERYT